MSSSDTTPSYSGRGRQGKAAGAAGPSNVPATPSQSVARENQDHRTPYSVSTLSLPRASTTATTTSSRSVESMSERRCSSPSPTVVSASNTSTSGGNVGTTAPINKGGKSGSADTVERGLVFSLPSTSPSPSPPTPAENSGDTLMVQQQHTVVLSPALGSSTSSSSSSSLTSAAGSTSPTASPSVAADYESESEDLSNMNTSVNAEVKKGSTSNSNTNGSSNDGGLSNNVNDSTNTCASDGAGSTALGPVNPHNTGVPSSIAGINTSLVASTTLPTSPSVSPTNASANPRRSLNAAFTISPRTESDVEVSEEYNNNDAPSVCLDLDRHDPPIKQYCNLSSLEERRAFVTTGCVAAAKAMSTQRIIDHLLPAMLTAFEADDYGESFDNCAPSIARALPQVIACMEQKTTANITYFMGLIMELCCSAEQVVVKETIASLRLIVDMMEDSVVLELFLPFVLTMRVSFWSAPRTVAASLLGNIAMRPAVLQASGLTVADMFNYYAESSSDASVMVRAGVVTSLHDWVKVASMHHLALAEMPLPLLRSLATDDLSDTVRYLMIEEIEILARLIGRKSTSKYLLSTYVSAFVDPSWRVRFTAASHLGTMSALVLNADDLEIVLKTLAVDEEPETRAAVARQLDTVVQHCSSTMIQHCCALVAEHFARDENPVVRRSAARHCHCFIYGNEEVVQTMCSFLVKLMEDASFTVQESAIQCLGDLITSLDHSVRAAEQQAALSDSVNGSTTIANGGNAAYTTATGTCLSSPTSSRSSTSKKQPQPAQQQQPLPHSRSGRHHSPYRDCSRLVSGMASASGSVNSTAEASVAFIKKRTDTIARAFADKLTLLSVSRNWRIRDVVICVTQYFPKVLSQDHFQPLTSIIFGALHDPVNTVRTQAVHTLKRVAIAYGGAWAAQTTTELLHSDILAPSRVVSYMWRVIMIQCLEVLLPVASELDASDVLRQQLLATTVALLQQYTADRVPNVRIATALALPKWFAWFGVSEVGRNAYNAAIHTLQQDTDIDVLDAAQHIQYRP